MKKIFQSDKNEIEMRCKNKIKKKNPAIYHNNKDKLLCISVSGQQKKKKRDLKCVYCIHFLKDWI